MLNNISIVDVHWIKTVKYYYVSVEVEKDDMIFEVLINKEITQDEMGQYVEYTILEIDEEIKDLEKEIIDYVEKEEIK